jgi:hypothetical protein
MFLPNSTGSLIACLRDNYKKEEKRGDVVGAVLFM